MKSVECPYCGNPAELVSGGRIYPHRRDLRSLSFWLCESCEAWVGTHKNSKNNVPLGRLANKELRHWKSRAHSYFDPLWRRKIQKDGVSKKEARTAGYKWLSQNLGIDMKDCHIGMFDIDQCRAVVDLCRTYSRKE